MLSLEEERRVRQHLRLAKGFLDTAVVRPDSSEFEERNALSRAYYAMFHACCAWLAWKYGIVRKLRHFELLDEMRRRRGKNFGDFVRDVRGMREAADYREEWKPQRRVSEDRLAKVERAVGQLEAEIGAELTL
jgi:uncharacterized protein (UPF0332 family)